MKKLLAFHNKESIKKKYLDRLYKHAKADEIIQGIYWENGKGCATGCVIHSNDPHEQYPKQLGIPETIAYLEDKIFEGLSNGEAKKFAVQFLEVIPVGADLSLVTAKFMVWLLVDKKDGVLQYAKGYPDVEQAIKNVAKLYKRKIKGEVITDEEWDKAARAARAAWAAEAAAWAAWAAWAAEAAARAAWAAEAAEAAAWAAEAAEAAEAAAWAAEAAARAAAYKKMAKKLISLLRQAK